MKIISILILSLMLGTVLSALTIKPMPILDRSPAIVGGR